MTPRRGVHGIKDKRFAELCFVLISRISKLENRIELMTISSAISLTNPSAKDESHYSERSNAFYESFLGFSIFQIYLKIQSQLLPFLISHFTRHPHVTT